MCVCVCVPNFGSIHIVCEMQNGEQALSSFLFGSSENIRSKLWWIPSNWVGQDNDRARGDFDVSLLCVREIHRKVDLP